MRDVELYRHLLSLETPWTVRSVELNVPGQRVGHPRVCPRRGDQDGLRPLPGHDAHGAGRG
jgi:hypothetical protein